MNLFFNVAAFLFEVFRLLIVLNLLEGARIGLVLINISKF